MPEQQSATRGVGISLESSVTLEFSPLFTMLGFLRGWVGLHILFFISFLVSGLAVNAVQYALFFTLGALSRDAFRRANYYLVYAIYSQLLFLADWWSGSQVVFHADQEVLDEMVGREHAVILMNHHYEIDWLFGWMVADRMGVLGNARVFLKKALR